MIPPISWCLNAALLVAGIVAVCLVIMGILPLQPR